MWRNDGKQDKEIKNDKSFWQDAVWLLLPTDAGRHDQAGLVGDHFGRVHCDSSKGRSTTGSGHVSMKLGGEVDWNWISEKSALQSLVP